MWRKGSVLSVAAILISVVIIGYVEVPSAVQDPVRSQIVFGYLRFIHIWTRLNEFLGYGSFLNSMRLYQRNIPLNGDLPSASFKDMQVKRTAIAKVPVLIYRPVSAPVLSPAMVYIHGGGFVYFTADNYDMLTYMLSKSANVVIVSINYRRAPQNPYPAPFHDCLEVTKNLLKHGKKYGINGTNVGIAGDGAGGMLAASVAHAINKEMSDIPPLKFLMLMQPMLQAFNFRLPSYVDYNLTLPLLTTRTMAAFISMYLGFNETDTERVSQVLCENRHLSPQMRKSNFSQYVSVDLLPKLFRNPKAVPSHVKAAYDRKIFGKIKDVVTSPQFSPLMSRNLSGLPPTFIQASEFDPLRDDALLYARRLQDHGVKVKLHFGHGGFHGDMLTLLLGKYLWVQSGKVAFTVACDFIKTLIK